jgi:hypothetical protein
VAGIGDKSCPIHDFFFTTRCARGHREHRAEVCADL